MQIFIPYSSPLDCAKALWEDRLRYNKQVERDKRLKDYCKENKIKLIVIKYNQIDKIEEILNKKLKTD